VVSVQLAMMRWLGLLCGALVILAAPPAMAKEELDRAAQEIAPSAFNNEPPAPKLVWGEGQGRSHFVPAAGIVGFDFLLNRFDYYVIGKEDFDVSFSTLRRNLTGKWVFDDDPFVINQFGHPYQGSMYHGFARSAGLEYPTSLVYTLLGSLFWETAGETTEPSINDQFTTGFGGSFLGEALFRLASLTLESARGRPTRWREFGAAAISPATGFNRWIYGERFDGVFRSNNPPVHTAVQVGANLNATVRTNLNRNPDPAQPAIPQSFDRGEGTVDFNVAYGLPGKPGYTYDRAFDYFHLQLTAATANVLENLIIRGLLIGRPYAVGDNYRGVWGLFGSYDYIAPQIFRVSTTAAGLGTTGQWWLSRETALQTTVVGSVGYGSGGVIRGRDERDYHNGVTPQALAAMRLIVGERLLVELTARDYYISDLASDERDGSENIARGELAVTLRVKDLHGVTVKYVMTHRDANYAELKDTRQTVGAVSIAYTYLGHRKFGAVDWRPEALESLSR